MGSEMCIRDRYVSVSAGNRGGSVSITVSAGGKIRAGSLTKECDSLTVFRAGACVRACVRGSLAAEG